MKLSRKTDYALRTLFTLIDNKERTPIPIRELARLNDIPKRFLEHIMLDLKFKGWVASVPGKRGGYRLLRSPDKITMGQVVRHFDDVLAPIPCTSVKSYVRCRQQSSCHFRHILLQIRNMTARLMDNATLSAVYGSRGPSA